MNTAHPDFNMMYESYCLSGAASIGKGIGGILFSRFSRSSGHVGGVEEEPSDSEGGASEVENVALGEEAVTTTESEEKDKQIEEERREEEPGMSQSTSAVMDSTSCKSCVFVRSPQLHMTALRDFTPPRNIQEHIQKILKTQYI